MDKPFYVYCCLSYRLVSSLQKPGCLCDLRKAKRIVRLAVSNCCLYKFTNVSVHWSWVWWVTRFCDTSHIYLVTF